MNRFFLVRHMGVLLRPALVYLSGLLSASLRALLLTVVVAVVCVMEEEELTANYCVFVISCLIFCSSS